MSRLLVEVAISTFVIYAFLILAIRLIGRRSLAQLSALDLIVVILLGSAVETAMVQANTSIKAGLVSATVLLVVNRVVTLGMMKSKKLRHLVGGGPVLIVEHGRFVEERMWRVGLTEADVRAALRAREIGSIEEVRYAVLETDGRINVVPVKEPRNEDAKGTSLI